MIVVFLSPVFSYILFLVGFTRPLDRNMRLNAVKKKQQKNLITYLKNWDCTHSDKNDYPDVHFGSQSSPVVSVIVAVVLLRVIQHVVIVPAWFIILQDIEKSHVCI